MGENRNTTQPPIPPANGPADIFDDVSHANHRVSNANHSYSAVDLAAVNEQLERFIEYIQETRVDLEAGGASQGWIDQLFAELKEALAAVRSFEIDHAEDAVARDEGNGLMTEVVLRDQDPNGFDMITEKFEAAATNFQDYFEKHRAVKLGLQ